MRLFRNFARWSSSALAILLLASSLTCLTAACRTLCAPRSDSSGLATAGAPAAADLPPCHRRAAAPTGAEGDLPSAPAGGCDAGSPCCAQWLNDHATLRVADPATLRSLLPAAERGAVALLALAPTAFAGDPPNPGLLVLDNSAPPPARPRNAIGSRGPPSVAPAA